MKFILALLIMLGIFPAQEATEIEVEFSITTSIVDGRLRVTGQTNLPRFTNLSASLTNDALITRYGTPYMAQNGSKVRQDGEILTGTFGYVDGCLPDGIYELGITVPFYRVQDDRAKPALGEGNSNLTGPLVEEETGSLAFMGKTAHFVQEVRVSGACGQGQ